MRRSDERDTHAVTPNLTSSVRAFIGTHGQLPPAGAPTARARRRRVWTIASGVVAFAIGGSLALAGAAATAYADGMTAETSTERAASVSSAMTAMTAVTAMVSPTKHERTISYPLAQVWPATLRYLRVDQGYALVDRDAEAGFILFDIPVARRGGEDRTVRGSIEMFATEDMSGRPSVHVSISTEGGPTHLPHTLAEGLASKLKRERGAPAPPPPKGEAPNDQTKPDDGQPPLVDPPLDP